MDVTTFVGFCYVQREKVFQRVVLGDFASHHITHYRNTLTIFVRVVVQQSVVCIAVDNAINYVLHR